MNAVIEAVSSFLSSGVVSALLDFFITALNTIISLLPDDPFVRYLNFIDSNKYLKYLNWFVPISDFIAIGEAWLAAIIIFYTYSFVLRFFKAID